VDYLIAALADPRLRLFAASSLGEIRAHAAVPALVRNLNVKNDPVRNAAVKALGRIGDPSAIPSLVDVACTDEAAGVRTTAIDALATLGAPEGVQLMARLALEPAAVLAGTTRFFEGPVVRWIRRSHLRFVQTWAARRLRQLHLVEALPLLEPLPSSLRLLQRLRLRRTIRVLRAR